MRNCKHPFGWQEKRRFRHYHPIDKLWGGKCPKCKGNFDTETLGHKNCPSCKVELKPRWEVWSEIYCPLCKETIIYQGLLKNRKLKWGS